MLRVWVAEIVALKIKEVFGEGVRAVNLEYDGTKLANWASSHVLSMGDSFGDIAKKRFACLLIFAKKKGAADEVNDMAETTDKSCPAVEAKTEPQGLQRGAVVF